MIAIGRQVEALCAVTRAGWSWMLLPEEDDGRWWLAFHGARGWRGASDLEVTPIIGEPRLELWSSCAANTPLVTVAVTANQHFREIVHRTFDRPVSLRAGWLILLSLLHALDEAARARPRVPSVGEALTATGTPTLSTWASALTLGDLEAALLRARC